LLERKDVDPNTQDEEGHTALFDAAAYGHIDVVKALLQHNDTDINLGDGYGNTPLTCAAEEANEEIVALLKVAEKLNGKTPNEDGDTVL